MSRAGDGALAPASELVERALGASRAQSCVVVVEDRSDADVRFANNTTTTNGQRRDRRVSVVSIVERADGAHAGVASRSGGGDVTELVRASEADAEASPVAEDASPLLDGGADADFAAEAETTSLAVLGEVLLDLRGAFARAKDGARVLAGFATHELTTTYLGTSAGTRRRHVQPTGTLELVARTGDGTSSTWAGVGTEDFSDVSLAALEQRLVDRIAWSRRRVELEAGRYEVILPPDAVADLVIEVAAAASGRAAEDGGSVFSSPGGTRLGEQLCPLPFDLYGDPAAEGLASVPFVVAEASGTDSSVFDNGCPVGRADWIDAGHLGRLRYHRAGASRSGTAFTPWIDNLVLELPGASGSLADVIARTDRALLLTCLWYIREVDPSTLLLTGLTRDGVYLVEHGEVVGAVNNFRFNESPLDMLSRTIEASASERALSREWGEWMSRTRMPALRVGDFNMSSVSQAS